MTWETPFSEFILNLLFLEKTTEISSTPCFLGEPPWQWCCNRGNEQDLTRRSPCLWGKAGTKALRSLRRVKQLKKTREKRRETRVWIGFKPMIFLMNCQWIANESRKPRRTRVARSPNMKMGKRLHLQFSTLWHKSYMKSRIIWNLDQHGRNKRMMTLDLVWNFDSPLGFTRSKNTKNAKLNWGPSQGLSLLGKLLSLHLPGGVSLAGQQWDLYYFQWPFQDPTDGGTYHIYIYIYKAYFWGLCKGISPENMALYGTNIPPI